MQRPVGVDYEFILINEVIISVGVQTPGEQQLRLVIIRRLVDFQRLEIGRLQPFERHDNNSTFHIYEHCFLEIKGSWRPAFPSNSDKRNCRALQYNQRRFVSISKRCLCGTISSLYTYRPEF